MYFIEQIRVGQERAETGFCAEEDRPSLVFGVREIGRIGVLKNAPAQGDELFGFFMRRAYFGFLHHMVPGAADSGSRFTDYLAGWTSAIKTS